MLRYTHESEKREEKEQTLSGREERELEVRRKVQEREKRKRKKIVKR